MDAAIREFHSPDADLETYQPKDPSDFSILVEFTAAPEGVSSGGDVFSLTVCTPHWIDRQVESGRPYWPRHHLLVREFDFRVIRSYIESYVRGCSGSSWAELAAKIGRLAQWEFEDYVEAPNNAAPTSMLP